MKPHSNTPSSSDKALPGFSHSRAQFEALVDRALAHAKKRGATNAAAEASEGCGLSVSVRKGDLENVERNRDKSLGITVYVGNRRGSASTSDFSEAAIERTVQAAFDIARFTAEDPMAGLPDPDLIAHEQRRGGCLGTTKPFLQRTHAWFSRRLRQFTPQPVGRAHCWHG